LLPVVIFSFNAFSDLVRVMGFIVRYGSVATPFPITLFSAKRYLLLSIIIGRRVDRSLDFPWHNSMSYWGIVEGKTTALQAVTRFSAACILVSAVLLHDGLLHHCRLRKIPPRHSTCWPWARGSRVVVK
jgi:hypothetical protein